MTRTRSGHRQVKALTTSLKQLFRSRGLTQRAIAEKLGVTERTVKRWLAGEGLMLDVVEDFCNILGLTFVEFCELSKRDLDPRPNRPTAEQLQALMADVELSFAFDLLLRGWTPQEIKRESGMAESVLVSHLFRLQGLGLIELLPHNKVRMLVARDLRWGDPAAQGRAFEKTMKAAFHAIDCARPDVILSARTLSLPVLLSEDIRSKFWSLICELVEAADAARSSNAVDKKWYSILLAAHPFDPATLGKSSPGRRGRAAGVAVGAGRSAG